MFSNEILVDEAPQGETCLASIPVGQKTSSSFPSIQGDEEGNGGRVGAAAHTSSTPEVLVITDYRVSL